MKTLMEEVRELEIRHWNWSSDLYLPVTEVTKELIKKYGYEKTATMFVNLATGKVLYDIPFAYYPKEKERLFYGQISKASL